MSGLGTHTPPARCPCIAVCILYQIEHILYVLRHLFHWNSALLPVSSNKVMRMCGRHAGVLARHTGSKHRQRLCTQVLAEQEIFMIAKAACLMITPQVGKRLTLIKFAYRTLPVINIIYTVAMGHATSGETHKLWFQAGKYFGKVGTQTVFTPLERSMREQRHHIDMQCTASSRSYEQFCRIGIS